MRTILLATAASTALTGATAMAQNANDSDTKMNPTSTHSAAIPQKGPNFVTFQNSDMLSSNVIGLDIYNQQNDDVGKIQDIAVDSSKKMIGYILSVGGFLGMGTHYVAVDPDALAISYDANNKVWRASMNATKDQLKAAPEFKYDGQWTASRS